TATLSALVADLPKTIVTPEIRVDLPDAVKFEVMRSIQATFAEYMKTRQELGPAKLTLRDVITIDGVRAIFDGGWGLIRASNTQPALVLRFEAVSADRMHAIRALIEGELAAVRRALGR
ncbi:MAG: phosphomannomutase, partial [Nitrospira sp.]|nr:phosphomannomutase [Nitrospira sp.]